MILKLYKQLENVANNEHGDIIENMEIIHSHAGRAGKIGLELIDSTYIYRYFLFCRKQLFLSLGTKEYKKFKRFFEVLSG